MILIIVIFVISIWGLWKFIKCIRENKKIVSIPYLLIFLGFGTILVSMFYPGGFEGIAIAIISLLIGLLGILWAFIYSVATKINKDKD